MDTQHLIVVGAGQAGAELAVQARECGWPGRILLVGEEAEPPYHRPPLSKAYLAGAVDAASLQFKARAAYDKAGVELLLGRRVTAIDRASRRLHLADGTVLPWTRLALATGGRPRRLPAAAAGADQADNFHYLRTQADADRIRARLLPGARLVVIGGGYIGLEVAAVAVKLGVAVTVLEAAPRVLARVTAPAVSAFYERVHREAGVDLRCGAQLEGFTLDAARRRVLSVNCRDGERLPCDLVIAGIGLLPNTELAAEAGLAVDDGIVVDEALRTSDHDILAAGDCTRRHSQLYGRSIRLESVPAALEQARGAAHTLAGKPPPPEGVPWFWSDQYDHKLKMAGLSHGHDRCVLRGTPEPGSFCAFYLQGRRLLAVDTVNRVPDFMVAKRLVAEAIEVDDATLADETRPLKSLLPA